MKKNALLVGALCLTALIMWQWPLVSYAYLQAKGQLKIISSSVPVASLVEDPAFPDSLKQKLKIIAQARAFAMQDLDLKNSENYTTFYDQKGEVLLWNVSASEPYALVPYQWHFPLLGAFPYKGFFDKEKAVKEKAQLDAQGYDTNIRPVSGWSTLGWTKDPILSNMLYRNTGALGDLIIHELTHATIFIKNDIQFNENLASFIGQRGALLFLEKYYGKNSEAYFEFVFANEDRQNLIAHFIKGAHQLDSVYHRLENAPDSLKAKAKEKFISQIVSTMDTVHFHNSRYYDLYEDNAPNNARFMSFLRYHSSEDSLDAILKKDYHNDLRAFIKGMRAYHD